MIMFAVWCMQTLCDEATVFWDVHADHLEAGTVHGGGRRHDEQRQLTSMCLGLSAMPDVRSGFGSHMLFKVVSELQAGMPTLLGDRRLVDLRAYKVRAHV